MFYFIKRIFQSCLAKLRRIYCALYERPNDECIYTRYTCNYLLGLFVAWLLWKLVLINFYVSLENEFVLLSALFILIGLGFVFSTGLKCITLLTFVAIVGKSGRSYLRALSVAYIIAGPIENLATNGEEIVRVFACSTYLSYNLTKTRYDLLTKPFRNTLSHMKDNADEIQHSFAQVKDILEPLHKEVEGNDTEPNKNRTLLERQASSRAETIQNNYKKKFEKRCKGQLENGESRCRNAFAKAYDKCTSKFLPIVRALLCWPFRVDFVCNNILGDASEICDPSDAIPKDFGENFAKLEQIENELIQNANLTVTYKEHAFKTPPGLNNAKNTANQVMKEFKTKKILFDRIMSLMQQVLSLLFIRIIYASVKYHYLYRNNIDFDNIYISDYFKRIDERRKLSTKRSILPLKKFEKTHLVDLANTCARTKEESKAIIFHLMQLSLEIVAAAFFLLLDYLIATLLEIIHQHSEASYVQEGEHTVHFHVTGSGMFARLLRSTLLNFNMHERVSTFLSNEPCLPRPSILPRSFYLKLFTLYLVVVILIYKSSMFLRLRRFICAYFYKDREKHRVIFLYNTLLRQRRSIFEMMLKNVQKNLSKDEVRMKLNVFLKLRMNYPDYFDWLRWFRAAQRECLVCNSPEDEDFVTCSNTDCRRAYCHECWLQMGTLCIVCNQRVKVIQILNFDDFFKTSSV